MHIGVDATCWHNTRGYGRYARSLLRALLQLDTENRYTFVVDSVEPLVGTPPSAGVRVVPSRLPTALAASVAGRRSLRDMWRMSRALSSPDFDLLFYPTVYSYVPAFSRARKIVAIHDLIPEKYPQLTLPNRSARLLWQLKTGLGRRQATAITTVSDYSRRCLVDHFHLDPRRVHVVGEAPDPAFRRLERAALTERLYSLGVPEEARLVIYLGGFGPHKNVPMLVEAFAELGGDAGNSDCRLILVGEHRREVFHSEADAIEAKIRALGVDERVVFTGFVSDDEAVILLNRATVLVLPSLMEGFGLPAVEAAACGCPVIATSESPLPHVLGEGGLYFQPTDRQALVQRLESVLSSLDVRERMRRAGLAAAARLTWADAAGQMLDCIREVGSA